MSGRGSRVQGGGGWGGQGGCERRIEVFVKIKKKIRGWGVGSGGGWSGGQVEGQGRCELRSEVFAKIQKKNLGGSGRGGGVGVGLRRSGWM